MASKNLLDSFKVAVKSLKVGSKTSFLKKYPIFATSNPCVSDLKKTMEQTPFPSILRLEKFREILEVNS